MDSFGYIYKTTNKINGKIYIGQKSGSFQPSYFGSGVAITRAVHKYGRDNFKTEIIAFASTKEMLNELEIKNISEHRNSVGREFLYNMTDGGEGSLGLKHSDETKKKLRILALKQFSNEEVRNELRRRSKERFSIKENNPMFGNHHSEETKKKISDANKGPNFKLRGKEKSQEHRNNMKLAWVGRKKIGFPLETREKMRNSQIGKKHSEETKAKMVANHWSKH